MIQNVFIVLLACVALLSGAPSSELPGTEIQDIHRVHAYSLPLVTVPQKINSEIKRDWSAPGIEEQLLQDETMIGMEEGAIFVPRMTESRLEPDILVESLSRAGKTYAGISGHRMVVPPGLYKVFIGTGSINQQMIFEVDVNEGKTTVIEPKWAGLVVTTLSNYGEFVSENYEIFSMENGESFGKGYGLTQERISDLRTWILPPGTYRISLPGEDLGSLTNYITIRLLPGNLTRIELIYDETTGNLIAGGIQQMRAKKVEDSFWSFGLRIGGIGSYSTLYGKKNGEKSNMFTFIGDIRLRALYNRARWFGSTELYSRNNSQWINDKKQETSEFLALQDQLSLQSAWVYRLKPWVGPYVRGSIRSHWLPLYFTHPSSDSVVVLLSTNGDTLKTYQDQSFRIQPSFFPIRIGEGAGLNFDFFSGYNFELRAQSGLAWRQTLTNKVFSPLNEDETLFEESKSNHWNFEYGFEAGLTSRVRLGRSLTLDLRSEFFFEKGNFKKYRIEELTFDIRLALTRYLELSYQLEVSDKKAQGIKYLESEDRYESLNTVQIRLYINF